MSRRVAPIVINAGLALVALLVVFPLAWMLSVSFMQRGEASATDQAGFGLGLPGGIGRRHIK